MKFQMFHSVTNSGIRTCQGSWLSPDLVFILDRYLSGKWQSFDPADLSVWEGVTQIPDEELWRTHERCRERLVGWTRGLLKEQLTRRGASFDEIAMAAEEVLDPEALTIRICPSIRQLQAATLLLRDVARLQRLVEDSKRPIQFIFAGKAHPADQEGKELIKAAAGEFLPAIRLSAGRIVFLENYDINIARYLVQGVDVWLNTPRRGLKLPGTSGMKAAANGILNCSILDGWWVEGYAPTPAGRSVAAKATPITTPPTSLRARLFTTSLRNRSSRSSTSGRSTTSRASGSGG